MRNLFALLGLLGIVGIVSGIVIILRGSQGTPFTYESYGGPGPILAGVILLLGSLYLRSIWQSKE
ncbi:MAG TPA: hypothetical protein VH763_09165 [Gemmatimonadales bacterium]|jgi:hypothetical protein